MCESGFRQFRCVLGLYSLAGPWTPERFHLVSRLAAMALNIIRLEKLVGTPMRCATPEMTSLVCGLMRRLHGLGAVDDAAVIAKLRAWATCQSRQLTMDSASSNIISKESSDRQCVNAPAVC